MSLRKTTAVILFFTLLAAKSPAQLRLPSLISSGMVLQQNDSVSLWGWASPGEEVRVITSWDDKTTKTNASSMAAWRLKVKTPAAGGPYRITIKTQDSITLEDVMIGEVWLCSGQSNMEWNHELGAKDVEPELSLPQNQNIRFFQVPKTGAATPQDDVKAAWRVCNPESLKSFSAVGYFFGKKLQTELDVPVGLINASWGGTPAEPWTPEAVVLHDTVLKRSAEKLDPVPWWPVQPGTTYNGMIAPLTKANIAGVIWYQGESNTKTSGTYRQLFTSMIDAWRRAWKKELPFYYVQIAPYKYDKEYIGALLQEAQTQSMEHPETGMVVITDLIDSVANIHPSRKKPVGDRLAAWALSETYGKQHIAYKSPQITEVREEKGRLVLSVDHAGNGLVINGKEARGFLVSADTKEWAPARVKIQKDRILVWSKVIKQPAYVRYGFSNTGYGNIANKEGLPLIPYRNDQQPLTGEPVTK